jgi:T5SS/PEP-CTERM-associated repeat protein/autotransporter-associated beta strand protein
MNRRLSVSVWFGTLLLLADAVNLQAQFVWTGNSSINGSITDSTNWGGPAPTGSGSESLTFGTSGPQTNILVPTSAFTDINFTAGRPSYTFSGTGVTPVVTVNGIITLTTGNPVVFDNTLGISLSSGLHTVDIGGASTVLQVNGHITGAGGINLTNAGTLILSGTNTYSGGSNVSLGTLEVIAGGSISHATTNTIVGNISGQSGTLALSSGGIVSNYYSDIGQSAGSTGIVTVDGVGSAWTSAYGLDVGAAGNGSLAITNGGTVSTFYSNIGTNLGGIGAVTVNGPNSTWADSSYLYVGSAGTGALAITNGGSVSDTYSYIGSSAGSSGTVNVNGPGSSWINSQYLYVGESGTGSLAITNGGSVSDTYSYIGSSAGSTGSVIVSGAGSSWINSQYLYVGYSGTGSLAITNGGSVSDTYSNIGLPGGSSGTVTVDGAGSSWTNSSDVTVGYSGTGSLTLADSGKVIANGGAGAIVLANNGLGVGTLNIGAAVAGPAAAGGIVNAATISTGGGTGTLQFNTTATSGTPYYLTKDGTASGAAVTVTGSTSLINTAGYTVLTGADTYTGGTTINGGTLEIRGGSISHPGVDLTASNNSSFAITNGGSASTNHGFIGYNSYSSSATVTGSGSTWTLADELIVGAFSNGQGSLTISGGGVVSDLRGSISYVGPGTSYVTVDGAGSAWNNSTYLYVGSSGGNARLNVNNGGTAASATGEIGLNSGYGQATINGAGSAWTIATSLNVGNNGTGFLELVNDGRLNLAGGTGTITLAPNSGTGHLLIGDSESYIDGGIVNAAIITTGTGTGGINFDTGTTKTNPYYLTKDGTSSGAPVTITGSTSVTVQNGYIVLTGTNTYTNNTVLNYGTLVAGANGALGTSQVGFYSPQATLNVASGVTVNNTLLFYGGGTLAGNGTFGTAVNVGPSMIISPGNSPGNLTFSNGLAFSNGGEYDWQLQSVAGAPLSGAGTNWDLITVSAGTLDMSSLGAGGFTLKVISLNPSGNAGNVSDFNPASNYTWTIATAPTITGFNAGKFVVDTSGFSNSFAGSFSLSVSGSSLNLNFTAVPEPSTYALMLLGLGGMAWPLYRRRRS